MGELHVDAAVAFIKTLSENPKYDNKNIFKTVGGETALNARALKPIIDNEFLDTSVNLLVPFV